MVKLCNTCGGRNLMNDLKEYDIQAPLREFCYFVQMTVVKTILTGLVKQPTIGLDLDVIVRKYQ
jgi:hypothetical protein